MGRSAGTISRELKRHSLAEYRASLAHSSYQAHRKRCKATPKLLGKSGGACLVTLTDRKSRFELVKKIARKKAELVEEAMIALLQAQRLRSITPEQGKEFAKHHLVTQALGVAFYFPEPHQPWQRGTNENTNGLLREYFPKQQDINQWNDDDIQRMIDKLNLRSRKCLGWKTPCEV